MQNICEINIPHNNNNIHTTKGMFIIDQYNDVYLARLDGFTVGGFRRNWFTERPQRYITQITIGDDNTKTVAIVAKLIADDSRADDFRADYFHDDLISFLETIKSIRDADN
jgi:hypothetical protein